MLRPCHRLCLLAAATWLVAANTAVARADGEVVIGAVLTLSADEADSGHEVLDGLERAVAALNSAGGIEVAGVSVPVRLEVFDDKGSDRRAVALARVLIERRGAAAVIAGSRPAAGLAIAAVAPAYSVPYIDVVGLPETGEAGEAPYRFSVLPSLEDRWMPALAFAILVRRGQGSNAMDVPFALIAADPILRDTALRLAAVWGLSPSSDVGGSSVTLLLDDPATWRGRAEGGGIVIVPACDDAIRLRELRPAGAILCTALWRRDAGPPSTETSLGAEIAVLALAQAISRGRSAYGPVLRDVLTLLDVDTAWGPIRFGADGRNAALSTRLYAVEPGGLHEIDPADPISLWAEVP